MMTKSTITTATTTKSNTKNHARGWWIFVFLLTLPIEQCLAFNVVPTTKPTKPTKPTTATLRSQPIPKSTVTSSSALKQRNDDTEIRVNDRRHLLASLAAFPFFYILPSVTTSSTSSTAAQAAAAAAAASPANNSNKSCTDIESCREIGERKVEADQKLSPAIDLQSGVRYKVLRPGIGDSSSSSSSNSNSNNGGAATVKDGSKVELIYTISRAGGRYMYSQGFGNEKIDAGDGQKVKDAGLDALFVTVGKHQVPVGIEQALVGMKRGERRRVTLPASVGFETSNWQPAPRTARGERAIQAYKRILEGFGSQPAFAAPTIWDIEVLRIRS